MQLTGLSVSPCDGLEINNINSGWFMSMRKSYFSPFDQDNVCIELEGRLNGRTFYVVSAQKEAHRANLSRRNVNGYKDFIKGR